MKKKNIFRLIFIAIILIFSSFTGCIFEENPVSIVGKNVQYKTISDALLDVEDGDTVLIKSGLYHESFVISKSIILKGEDRENTIIQGSDKGNVIVIVANNVKLMNFTIKNAGNSSNPTTEAAIDIESSFNSSIENMIIHNNTRGIYMYNTSNIVIKNSIIKDNINRGFNLNKCSNITIKDNTLSNNSYGIYFSYVEHSSVTNTIISDHDGGGLYLGSLSNFNNITGNSFTDNHYGLHVKGSLNNTLKNNLFITNVRGLYLCCGGKDNLIYLNVFISNDEHAYGYPVNQFDNGAVGNYWDDYNGTDADGDGIGDIPYNATIGDIYGVSNIDNYPLMSPS